MSTKALKWATRLETWGQPGAKDGSDFWNVDCFVTMTNCPPDPGPDYDFGSNPNEITYQTANGTKTIIGAGQKSGNYYAFDPDTGAELWHTQVGPGSSLVGMEWGSASDGIRIYVAISNFYGIPYQSGNAGSWASLDPATGAILWQVADPNGAVDLRPWLPQTVSSTPLPWRDRPPRRLCLRWMPPAENHFGALPRVPR
jgi:polyvinyl alcohol dehydrogenase (cytochrome)